MFFRESEDIVRTQGNAVSFSVGKAFIEHLLHTDSASSWDSKDLGGLIPAFERLEFNGQSEEQRKNHSSLAECANHTVAKGFQAEGTIGCN